MGKMSGFKRVLLLCLVVTVLPTILIVTPLYLRHNVFADVRYQVAESDVLAIFDGMSSIFCSSHKLQMNSTFNAFQLRTSPQLSPNKKHLKLKKSMTLPDDTLEYWGFFLLEGALVSLRACARYPGSRVLVVRGEKNLNTCGLMEHNLKKVGATMDRDYKQVRVIFEHAEEMQPASVIRMENITKVGNVTDDYAQKRLHKAKNKTKKVSPSPSARTTQPRGPELKSRTLIVEEIQRLQELQALLDQDPEYSLDDNAEEVFDGDVDRRKVVRRDINQMLDGGIEHGGNAINFSEQDSSTNSVSSFEEDLLTCYDGAILLSREIEPNDHCHSVHTMDADKQFEMVHEVASDGYYYYIFYSDNDIENNIIHAVFDVLKPTFQYLNNSKECLNVTTCTFPIAFLSDETVIVEVPTHDGIEVDEDHVDLLISTCQPRMGIYLIFPLSVMFLVLACSFM